MVALLVLFTILTFLTVDYFVQRRRMATAPAAANEPLGNTTPLGGRPLVYRTPLGVFFDSGHLWSFLEADGTARVGIDDFAHSVMGAIDRFETRAVGDTVRAGDVLLKVRHGDHTAVLRAPFNGVIHAVNRGMLDRSDLRDVEPYTDGWLYRIEPQDTSVFRRMRIGEEARKWLSHEGQRLRVFLATVAPSHPVLGQTMADGGLPAFGLAEHLDDVNWTKLQVTFFG